jgi:hypothetical protein
MRNRLPPPICSRKTSALYQSITVAFLLACSAASAMKSETGPRVLTLFVDQIRGASTNPGTVEKPLKTIARAAEIALANYEKGVSTKILIQPGVYPEYVLMDSSHPQTDATITIQAVSADTVVLTGSDSWDGWQADSSHPGVYSHSWPYQWGECHLPQGWPASIARITLRREMVFVNGSPLTQVSSSPAMAEGTFYVDEARKQVLIRPRADTNLNATVIEVSVRSRLFYSHGISGLAIRGIRFEKANPCPNDAAVGIFNGSDTHVEDSTFASNNWIGLLLFNIKGAVVRHCTATHNGVSGFQGYQLVNVTYDGVESSTNNWRGAQGHFYYWAAGGAKFGRVHGGLFRNFRSIGNQTSGLWFDTDDTNIEIQSSHISQNQFNGLFLEANQGPITVRGSRICSNGAEGISILDSDRVSIEGNLIYGNKGAQIFADGRQKSRSDYDWQTREKYTAQVRYLTLNQNMIVGIDPSQMLFKTFQVDPDSATAIYSSLVAKSNVWYNVSSTRVFQIDPSFSGGQKVHNLDLAGWRSLTGQDRDSVFSPPAEDPSKACTAP